MNVLLSLFPSVGYTALPHRAGKVPGARRRCRSLLVLSLVAGLAACGQSGSQGDGASPAPAVSEAADEAKAMLGAGADAMADAAEDAVGTARLAAVLAAQPEEARARYEFRHPAETLAFFGIEPGMTVLEALPGGGWYTKILVPYLGTEGTLIGVDYDKNLFPLFGFMSDEALAAKETWPEDWAADARGWFDAPVAIIDAYQFGSLAPALDGSVDAVLFIRALHNMARFEGEGQFLTTALADAYRVLAPGGIVGIVQHMAPEDAPGAWASGSAGYLKKSFVVAAMEAAGFELVDESPINENPLDQPTPDDVVWRLPPTLSGAADNPELAEQRRAIGESTRMTLKFRKPA